jgi:hypothetical protein
MNLRKQRKAKGKTKMSNENKITPAQKRQLNIRLSDLMAAKDSYEDEEQFFAEVGRLTSMAMGAIPFEGGIEFKTLPPIKDKADEKTVVAFFYASATQIREVKQCLQRSLQLLHFPHGMNTEDPGVRRFRVNDVTRTAANRVFNANPHLFTQVTFSDTNREDSGIKVEPITEAAAPTQDTVVDIDDLFDNGVEE